VRTSDWTPARAIVACDPDLVPKPAPKRAPALKPAPMSVVQKFSLSADALFDFDKSVIKPAGMKKLGNLVATLTASQYDSVVITGHTDRPGAADYNQ